MYIHTYLYRPMCTIDRGQKFSLILTTFYTNLRFVIQHVEFVNQKNLRKIYLFLRGFRVKMSVFEAQKSLLLKS